MITNKVQECCRWEFAAKLGEFDYSKELSISVVSDFDRDCILDRGQSKDLKVRFILRICKWVSLLQGYA